MWSKEIPKEDGWYWIKYQGRQGLVRVPCEVTHIDDQYLVRTAYSGNFNSFNRKQSGFINAKFGPRIDVPEE